VTDDVLEPFVVNVQEAESEGSGDEGACGTYIVIRVQFISADASSMTADDLCMPSPAAARLQ
jgi:hypothetical protein